MSRPPTQPTPDPGATWLEDLVAGALEALDRGGDEGLAEFLAGHAEHRARVEELVAAFRGTGLLARDAHADLPERFGEFRLLQRLGGGGMGVVFLAEQESLGRTVALKIVRPDLLPFAGTRERFRREIDAIARLSHPAIVPIVATGEHDGMPWYAMQRIAGCSIATAVARLRGRAPASLTGLDLRRAIDDDAAIGDGDDDGGDRAESTWAAGGYWQTCVALVRQAADGLEHAHRLGVVHRDVKPANVMLTPDGHALLLDFGLARIAGDPRLTRTGGEPGSPAYMAPEQLRGRTADERADVYSLGATLFQLLDLEPPFVADDAEQLRQRILQGITTGPHNRAIPTELRVVLATAMEVDAERRYVSAAAFADDLGAVLEGRAIRARALPRLIRCRRWLGRHRIAAALLLAGAVMAIVLPAVLAWQQSRSLVALENEKRSAELSRDRALDAISRFLTRFSSGRLALLPGGRLVGGELLEDALRLLDDMPEADPALLRQHRTHARRWLVASQLAAGQVEAAIATAQATLALWSDGEQPPPGMAFLLAGVRLELLRLAVDGAVVEGLDEHLRRADVELTVAAEVPELR
ncbi:MAG: serine/threonine protein kinase, partial [Planctomycetes bacterium]|nr:serine/threonine protein kinase [Planctomycetota bacterium]